MQTPTPKVMVIAGNRQEAVAWIQDYDYRDKAQHLSRPMMLMGKRNVQYVLTGHYNERQDWPEIESLLVTSEAERVG